MTCYEVLGVEATASDEIIYIAYQSLAKKYDISTYQGDRDFAEYKMKRINKAYGILSDPDTRRKYDIYLQKQKAEAVVEQEATPVRQPVPKKQVKMKYCTHCGVPIEETATKCLKCGYDVHQRSQRPLVVREEVELLRTNRTLLKTVVFSLLTFGIYGIVQMSNIGCEINTIASRYDKKKTMHYCLIAFLFSGLTLGIAPIVWQHKISKRIGNELYRRDIDYSFGASTFWLWGVLGSFILVGAFVYHHKLLTAMNLLAEDYNNNGA